MLCYRDRTYCSAPCGNTECSRNVTPEIEADAIRWTLTVDPTATAPLIAWADLTCSEFRERSP